MCEVPILLLPGTPLIYVVTSVEAKPAHFWNPMGTNTPDQARQGNESRLTRLRLQRAESVQQVLRVRGGALAAALD